MIFLEKFLSNYCLDLSWLVSKQANNCLPCSLHPRPQPPLPVFNCCLFNASSRMSSRHLRLSTNPGSRSSPSEVLLLWWFWSQLVTLLFTRLSAPKFEVDLRSSFSNSPHQIHRQTLLPLPSKQFLNPASHHPSLAATWFTVLTGHLLPLLLCLSQPSTSGRNINRIKSLP